MFRDAYANANRVPDPYAGYRQAPPPAPAADPYALLRQFMDQAQESDPHAPRMDAAPESTLNDPFTAMRDTAAAMHRRGPPSSRQQHPPPHFEEPTPEERHPLGPPGKTKEGYDCYIGYDRECFPVRPSEPRSGGHHRNPYPTEAYESYLNTDGTRNGVLEPSNPHCDPEYDPDCRLRRFEPEQGRAETRPKEDHHQGAAEGDQEEQYEAEPYQSGQEEPYMSYQPPPPGMPSLQDILRSYGDRFPEQDDHRAYADDYRKK